MILRASEIVTPTSHLNFNGTLGADEFRAGCRIWMRMIFNRGMISSIICAARTPIPFSIKGRATWAGKLTGELGGPTFAGHVHAFNASYGALYWDDVEGDLTYSPAGFQLARAHARRGNSSAQFDVALTLDEWSF